MARKIDMTDEEIIDNIDRLRRIKNKISPIEYRLSMGYYVREINNRNAKKCKGFKPLTIGMVS